MSKKRRTPKTLSIVGEGHQPRDVEVTLCGKNITSILTKLELKLDAGKPHELIIHILPKGIDVDVDALVKTLELEMCRKVKVKK